MNKIMKAQARDIPSHEGDSHELRVSSQQVGSGHGSMKEDKGNGLAARDEG